MAFGKAPPDWRLQHTLLAGLPRGSALRALAKVSAGRKLRLRCERSMPFELVSDFVGPFMRLWDAEIAVSVSDYDPSLAGALRRGRGEEDVLLLWIDWRLHRAVAPGQAARWGIDRAAAGRGASGNGVSALINHTAQGGADACGTESLA